MAADEKRVAQLRLEGAQAFGEGLLGNEQPGCGGCYAAGVGNNYES